MEDILEQRVAQIHYQGGLGEADGYNSSTDHSIQLDDTDNAGLSPGLISEEDDPMEGLTEAEKDELEVWQRHQTTAKEKLAMYNKMSTMFAQERKSKRKEFCRAAQDLTAFQLSEDHSDMSLDLLEYDFSGTYKAYKAVTVGLKLTNLKATRWRLLKIHPQSHDTAAAKQEYENDLVNTDAKIRAIEKDFPQIRNYVINMAKRFSLDN